jgi:hypothetical protein
MSDQPAQGGSYVRDKDGTLKRVEFTAPEAAPAAMPAVQTEAATPDAESVSPAKGRKVKE